MKTVATALILFFNCQRMEPCQSTFVLCRIVHFNGLFAIFVPDCSLNLACHCVASFANRHLRIGAMESLTIEVRRGSLLFNDGPRSLPLIYYRELGTSLTSTALAPRMSESEHRLFDQFSAIAHVGSRLSSHRPIVNEQTFSEAMTLVKGIVLSCFIQHIVPRCVRARFS